MTKKITRTVVCLGMVLLMLFGTALAEGITPYADSEFMSATASLSTRKDVSFSCYTYEDKASIKVTACWLEKKSGTTFSKVCNLPAPTEEYKDNFAYAALMDYSAYIGTGTYRVGFTVNADGHAISRYSNERTF